MSRNPLEMLGRFELRLQHCVQVLRFHQRQQNFHRLKETLPLDYFVKKILHFLRMHRCQRHLSQILPPNYFGWSRLHFRPISLLPVLMRLQKQLKALKRSQAPTPLGYFHRYGSIAEGLLQMPAKVCQLVP